MLQQVQNSRKFQPNDDVSSDPINVCTIYVQSAIAVGQKVGGRWVAALDGTRDFGFVSLSVVLLVSVYVFLYV